VPYFQDLARDSIVKQRINNFAPLTMQPGDLLGISVTSLNHDADLMFNYNLTNYNLLTGPGSSIDREAASAVGYLIDQDGNIKLPIIGLVKVAGYTTNEVSALIESRLQAYLSKPVVSARILNFKISVLGDVKVPGSFTIHNEKISITQALSLAGDLNTTALRKNVLLIREVDGTREYINIDLTSKNIFNSPYYYLKNNDVIYAQPNRVKVTNDSEFFTKLGIALSVLTFISVLLFRYR
jgi:polysaccharide export outer membrane protein